MKNDAVGLLAREGLKYWKLPIFIFVATFLIAVYVFVHKEDKYCDEGLIILGTNTGSRGKITLIEDPYIAEVNLNMVIAGINDSIKGVVHTNADAFEMSTKRVVEVGLEGGDPRAVRAALKEVLDKFYRAHEKRGETKFSQGVRDYHLMVKKQDEKKKILNRIVLLLSADKSIPVAEYQQYKQDLINMDVLLPPVKTETIITLPDNEKAKLCESKTILEIILLSAGWGLIGSLMAIFGFQFGPMIFKRG